MMDGMLKLEYFAREREQIILRMLKEKRRITVSELSGLFEASGTTIRRQLRDMEQAGLLIRTHGGAISMEEASMERSLETKTGHQTLEKQAIARAASPEPNTSRRSTSSCPAAFTRSAESAV
jgi:DeoR family fructose operon transcriptional repressor